jgi:glycosyltransferase involved in cell wall biosynthesis
MHTLDTRTLMGFHMPRDGYGVGTIKLSRAAREMGWRALDMRDDTGAFGETSRTWAVPGTAVALCVPDWLDSISADQLVSYTMFEASRLPAGWADAINRRAETLLVPCAWCAEVFRDNGVTRPIHVVPWGVDARDYPFSARASRYSQRNEQRNDMYVFMWSGTPDLRKGWDLTYRAFVMAFGRRSDVRLVMHFRDELPASPRFADENVKVISGLMDTETQLAWLTAVDCYVFPSRGEGWGSPPREAASTGLPVITTNYGGLAVDIDKWAMPVGVAGTRTAEYGAWDAGQIGDWAEPDIDQLVSRLRWCAEHREAASAFGAGASAWIHANMTWAHAARALDDIINPEFALRASLRAGELGTLEV